MKKLATLLPLIALLVPTAALAQEAKPAEGEAPKPAEVSKAGAVGGDTTNHFGEKGTIALHVTTGPMIGGLSSGGTPTFGIETRKVKPEGGETDSQTLFYLNPRIHYFVVHNISIGGEILVARAGGEGLDGTRTAWGFMPKVGFDLLFGEKFSFYPQAGVGYRRIGWTSKVSGVPGSAAQEVDASESWFFADVDLPLFYHPVPNLAVGIGPQMTFTLAQSRKMGDAEVNYTTTSYRWLTAHLLGWF